MPTLPYGFPFDMPFRPRQRLPPGSMPDPGSGSGLPLPDPRGPIIPPSGGETPPPPNRVTIPTGGSSFATPAAPVDTPTVPDFENDMQRLLYQMFVNRAGYFRGLSGMGREIPGFAGTSPDVLLLPGGGIAYGSVGAWSPKPAAAGGGGGGGYAAPEMTGGGGGEAHVKMSIPKGERTPDSPVIPIETNPASNMVDMLRQLRTGVLRGGY